MNLQEIKSQHDIVGVIGNSVQLKKRGRLYSGICPLHKDTNPSLKVYPDRQFFKCYGCGKSGDVIDWIQLTRSVDFKDALKLLGNLPQAEVLFEPATKKHTVTMRPEIAEYWHILLGKKRTYFHNRGFANATIDREQFGWNGRQYVIPLWEGIPQESNLLAMKLRRDDELELGRLKNDNSNWDNKQLQNALKLIPKYILKGSYEPILYNSWAVENREEIWIFFGEFDAALATQLGLNACSPVHGAASWQLYWGETYLRAAKQIFIVPDKGEEKQGHRVKAMLGGCAKVYSFPEGPWKDFSEFILAGNYAEELRNGNGC